MPKQAQHQFYTGSTYVGAQQLAAPESGNTRLFTVPTAGGWKVEIGDATYPIRYWNGTTTDFSVDSTGAVYAKSMTIENSAGVVGLTLAGTNASAFAMQVTDNAGARVGYISSSGINVGLTLGGSAATVIPTIDLIRSNVVALEMTIATGGEGQLAFGNSTTGLGGAAYLSAQAADVLTLGIGTDAGAFEMSERTTAPSAPAANYVRLYAIDNGAGKTQLMARFNTGAVQQVAIQP